MRIAITGGIGSGKSFVCRKLNERGIDVYDCDSAAKRLMHTSQELKDRLTALIGKDTYINGLLNKAAVSKFLLESEDNKNAINRIVHPAVINDFDASGLSWMECAILFEANLEHTVDTIVCVTAPEDVRIRRIMMRDSITEEQARQWIRCQMSQEEMLRHSDYEIINDGIQDVDEQLNRLNIL